MVQNGKYVDREIALHSYGSGKPLKQRKQQITPWSFYQEQQQLKTFQPTPLVKDPQPIEKRTKSLQEVHLKQKLPQMKPLRHSPVRLKRQQDTAKTEEAKQSLKIEIANLGKDITELVKERVLLRVIAKYMEIQERTAPKKGSRGYRPIPEINLNDSLQKQAPSKQTYRSSELAFDDIQLQIHSIPPQLKLRLARVRHNSRLRLLSQRQIIGEQQYTQYNFKRSIHVSGERKQVISKNL